MAINLVEKGKYLCKKTDSFFHAKEVVNSDLVIAPAFIFLSKSNLLEILPQSLQGENESSLTTDCIIVGGAILAIMIAATAIGRRLGRRHSPGSDFLNRLGKGKKRISIKYLAEQTGQTEQEVIEMIQSIREKYEEFEGNPDVFKLLPGRDAEFNVDEFKDHFG